MFIAIKGEHFDGSNFVDEALKKGAVIVLADHKRYQERKIKNYLCKIQFLLLKISENIVKGLKVM